MSLCFSGVIPGGPMLVIEGAKEGVAESAGEAGRWSR